MTIDIDTQPPDESPADLDDAEFEFDEEAGPDDIDGDDDLGVTDEGEDLDGTDDLLVVAAVPGLVGDAGAVTEIPVAPGTAAALVEPEADDDVLLTDEVEASLDVILAERLRSGEDDADDDVEDDEDDGVPNQLATIIPVRRPEEFLCQSCFLLKPPGQLADADHQLCRDCA